MKRILCVAAAVVLALGVMATTAQAQSDSVKIRIHVPFSFTVENTTFDAGDYLITEPSNQVLRILGQSDRASSIQHVQFAHSRQESDGQVKLVFHRYGAQYFLAVVSNGTSESTFDFQVSNQEQQVADATPKPHLNVVSVLANGSVESANAGR